LEESRNKTIFDLKQNKTKVTECLEIFNLMKGNKKGRSVKTCLNNSGKLDTIIFFSCLQLQDQQEK